MRLKTSLGGSICRILWWILTSHVGRAKDLDSLLGSLFLFCSSFVRCVLVSRFISKTALCVLNIDIDINNQFVKLETKFVLVMDNASFHHSGRIDQICLESGVKLVYLPPHSPGLNPIEESFAKLKAFIWRNWQTYEEDSDLVQLFIQRPGLTRPAD